MPRASCIAPTCLRRPGSYPLPASTADAADWTWDDYLGIVEQLNGMDMDGTSLYGTTVIGAQPVPVVHMYTQLSASYGTRWFEQFPNAPWDFTPTINSAENLAALQDWKRLYDMSPPESINYLWFDAGTRFSQGDVALFYHWTPYFYLVNNEGYLSGQPSPVVDKFETAVLPTRGGGSRPGCEPGRVGHGDARRRPPTRTRPGSSSTGRRAPRDRRP